MKQCFRVGAIAVAAGALLGGCQAGGESGQASVPIRFAEEAAERGIADIGLDGDGVDALNSAPPTPAARMIPMEPNTLSKPITAPRSRGGAS